MHEGSKLTAKERKAGSRGIGFALQLCSRRKERTFGLRRFTKLDTSVPGGNDGSKVTSESSTVADSVAGMWTGHAKLVITRPAASRLPRILASSGDGHTSTCCGLHPTVPAAALYGHKYGFWYGTLRPSAICAQVPR